MQPTKQFKLADVLSITTGRLIGDMQGIYEILGFMTGKDLMTPRLLRACKPCKAALLEQFTFLQGSHMEEAKENLGKRLACIDKETTPGELRNQAAKNAIASWLVDVVAGSFGLKFPAAFDVAPLGASSYTKMDPIQELQEMAPNAQITVIGA